ncbi:MAG: hypothetical protein MZV63_63230 [Marinilabiliales bacterium]|nr:hypothetical protein [Marinilabiliales bacterium]
MWWDGKIQRTFRCRLEQRPASLGELLSAIGRQGGLIGEIRTVHMGGSAVDRDITVYADDLQHLDRIVKTVEETLRPSCWRSGTRSWRCTRAARSPSAAATTSLRWSTLRKVYTPGVAEVCLKIRDDPALARRYTSIRHLVAIVTDGTAVLGLGDIGPKAAMPVMEGKASLLETLTGLSGMPILLDTKDPDEIVETVVHDRADVRGHPARGHLRPPLLRDRGAHPGPARHPRHARRPARHGRGRHGHAPQRGQSDRPGPRPKLDRGHRPRRRRHGSGQDADVPLRAPRPGRRHRAGRARPAEGRRRHPLRPQGHHGRVRRRHRHHRGAGPDQGRHGPQRPDHPGPLEPQSRDRAGAGPRAAGAAYAADGKSVNNVLGFPGHLPRRRGRQRSPHHPRDAHRRGRSHRRFRQAGRGRPRPARQGPAQGGGPGRGPRGPRARGLNRDDLTGYFGLTTAPPLGYIGTAPERDARLIDKEGCQ